MFGIWTERTSNDGAGQKVQIIRVGNLGPLGSETVSKCNNCTSDSYRRDGPEAKQMPPTGSRRSTS